MRTFCAIEHFLLVCFIGEKRSHSILIGDSKFIQQNRGRDEVVERSKSVLQSFQCSHKTLLPSLLALSIEDRSEELARIAQLLGIFAHLVPCLVVDRGEFLPPAFDPAPKARESVSSKGASRVAAIDLSAMAISPAALFQPMRDVQHDDAGPVIRQCLE